MNGDDIGAAGAEALQDQIDDLRHQAGTNTTLLEAVAGSVVAERASVAEAVAGLEETVEALVARDEPDATPKKRAQAWVDYATGDDWVELADWVDWVGATYDLRTSQQIKPCWAAHLGVAEELAALWSAWKEAATKARTKDPEALAFWHDRYLAPVLVRLNTIYSIQACTNERHEHPPTGRPTNRALIDVRSAADPDIPRAAKDLA